MYRARLGASCFRPVLKKYKKGNDTYMIQTFIHTTGHTQMFIWKNSLAFFLMKKKAEGRRERTITDYRKHVTQFFTRYPNAQETSQLRPALWQYLSEDIAPATYNLRFTNLKAFFNFCIEEGTLDFQPLEGMHKRKDHGRAIQISRRTICTLLTLPSRDTFVGVRDLTLILLTIDTGIRPSEALSLCVHDIDIPKRSTQIRSDIAKTWEPRQLFFSQEVGQALKRFFSVRHKCWGNDIPIFCTEQGTHLSTCQWAARMRTYSESLPEKVRPYDLRHFFSLEFLRYGANVFALQKMLGHTDLSMSKRYVALTQADISKIHRKASPVKNILNGNYAYLCAG